MVMAVRVHQTGGPDVMTWEEVEVGEPGPGEVRIRHTAIGLNFIDTYYRSGLYPAPKGLPFIPGNEGAGVVLSVGEDVTNVKPGDRFLLGGADCTGAPSGRDPRRYRRQDCRRHDAEGYDGAIPAAPDL